MRLIAMFLMIAVALHPTMFFYILQDITPDRVPAGVKLLVIDATVDGYEFFSPEELKRFRRDGMRILAYVSVGEAEDYRYYWEELPKDLVLGENPDWTGNYTVKYWDPRWHAVIRDYISRVLDIGFDGVYLDKVDAYWDVAGYGYDEKQAALWMKEFIEKIRFEFPNALIYLQNGDDIVLRYPELAAKVDGLGVEDLFFDGRNVQPWGYVIQRLMGILIFLRNAKPVLVIDYVWKGKKDSLVDAFCLRCRFFGLSCYAAPVDRSLSGGGMVCPVR